MRRDTMRKLMVMAICMVFMGMMPLADAWGEELIVSAAASLTAVMTDIGNEYEKIHPDTQVIFNFAASGSLLQQMVHGAPVDVFASANQLFMNRAEEEGLILRETRRDFVRNSIVLAVPAKSTLNLRGLNDLYRKEVLTIVVGNPDVVPAGRYARQALTMAGMWDTLVPKMVYANSVSQVLDYLKRDEVEAGLFYSTDAFRGGAEVEVVCEVVGHDPIIYPIAVSQSCSRTTLAKSFLEYVCGNQAGDIFREHGFQPLVNNTKR